MTRALDPLTLEAAASDSWGALNHGNPMRALSVVLGSAPECYAAHKKNVEALLRNSCDPEKAIRDMTKNRQGLDDCIPDAQSFHKRLAAYLKVWAKQKGIEARA